MRTSKHFPLPLIRIVIVDKDPLRFVGFRTLLETEADFDLIYTSIPVLQHMENVDVVLFGNRRDATSFDDVIKLKTDRPNLRIIAVGSGMRDETILAALASGAKGYVDEAAPAAEFVRAVREVTRGSVWASRRVLSMFLERATISAGRLSASTALTAREKEVLEMLMEGRSNKDIGEPLGIAVRTVKAHVAKLMRKVGVRNRVALSTHAAAHSLIS